MDAECDRAIKNKKHALNRMKCTRSQTDIIIFKRCRAIARRTVLAAKETSWRHYCSGITNNAKLAKVWQTTAKFSGKRASIHIPSLTHNGITGRNDKHKAHILASHYASSNVDTYYPSELFTKLPHLQIALQRDLQLTAPADPRLNEPFSLDELQAVIKSSPNTAPGLDNICYQMFKHMSPVSLQLILKLFNRCWLPGKLLPRWKHSIVLPVPKADKPTHLPSSYRPICLTSHVCKLEKMVVQGLKWYLEFHGLLDLKQSGFRARRRTADHILRLHDAVQKALANKHNVLAVFIDIEKAYDMVNKNSPFVQTVEIGHTWRDVAFHSVVPLSTDFSS